MGYKNKTEFYRIPVMGAGDKMTQQQNMIQMTTVDNLLYAANFGCSKCFLQQGKYVVNFNQDKTACELQIIPYENDGFSLMGIINYRLFYSRQKIKLVFVPGKRYYVYVEYNGQLQYNPKTFDIKSYTYMQEINNSRMLLFIIETVEPINLDTDVNKVYAKNIISHTSDNTNPHGRNLNQENLFISNNLYLQQYKLNGYYYASYITSHQGNKIMFPKNKKIIFATAYPEFINAGIISWKIYENYILFNNSGDSGITVNVKLQVI